MYVTGPPLKFLRVDGLVLFVLAIVVFFTTDQPLWIVPLLLFVPDVFMAGYAKSSKVGALIYNFGHSYFLPGIVSASGWVMSSPLTLGVGLIWFAHVGMDRALGYGLKYDDNFKHTHLGSLFKHEHEEGGSRR